MEFIGFDLETTGILSHVDQIVEIAAVRFKDGKPTESFQQLVSIDIAMPKEASAINGITDEMLKGQPSIEETLPKFAHFCRDTIMVAHNAVFDFQFLAHVIQEKRLPSPQGIVLDTYNLSRKIFPGLSNYKLVTLCDYLKINSKEFHRAKADSISCGYLFANILTKLPSQDLKQIIKFSGKAPLKFPKNFFEGQMSLF